MSSDEIDDFWAALRPIIFVSQLFSLFPVEGIFAKDNQQIVFRWVSLRTFYSLSMLGMGGLVIVAQLNHVASSNVTASSIAAILYYAFNYGGMICFLIIAIQWRTIMSKWRSYEEVFLHPPYWRFGRSMRFYIRAVGCTVLLLAFIEDFIHVVSCYVSNREYIARCDNSTPFWEVFYTHEHSHIFGYISYSLPVALIVEMVHKVYLFIWSFMDLFITLVSLGLSLRFEQFYARVEHLKGKVIPDSFWAIVRLDYTKLSNLVLYMDEVLSPMVLLTCGSDIFFITYQLYMSVQINASALSTFYYRISLTFLILRALLMLLASSHIFVASRKPLQILRAVPTSSWNVNVQRFTNEILNIDNALSGHKFFFLKRTIILAMAGTMITYELVMLSEVKSTDRADFCEGSHQEFHGQRKQAKFDQDASFLLVMRPIIVLGQTFGIFPVLGYGSDTASKVHFKVFSFQMFYSLLMQLGGSMMSGFSLATFWTTGVEFSKILSWMFFTINLMITLGFTALARIWPKLMVEWENTVRTLPERPQLAANNMQLRRKAKLIMTCLMFSALFEHALAKPAGLYRAYKCGIKNLLEAHLMQAFPEMYSFIPYNAYLGFTCQIITSILTFYWNYIDLFLMVLCIGLRQNIKHINDIILRSSAEYGSLHFWTVYWKHYQKVCELVQLFKIKLAYFVAISFANNLFFICIQMLGLLKDYPGLIVAVYYWYSFGHLVTRMVLVALYAADIHDESRRLLPLFRTISTQYYSKEVQRFHEQVLNDKVALSGFGFFHLTRQLILKIAGTIVTYELVLLQVNDAEEKNGDQNPCT
ncbi:uncharacterized protein LOC129729076 [Wyeomyia smithii]|uniref:uncharacterized protein LOC129729076 n=1 Tax=Wyeomyia smithii TaxID=174621 RepID=UPI00246820A1|nr:uncharacterized protein LOC129729076 [Wyeomyia smithii]